MEPTIQRWSAKRKVELLLSQIKGQSALVDVCRERDLKQFEVEGWMSAFLKAGKRALKATRALNSSLQIGVLPRVSLRRLSRIRFREAKARDVNADAGPRFTSAWLIRPVDTSHPRPS